MKIKLSRQQWQKIGQAAGWEDEFAANTPGDEGWKKVDLVTYHRATKQAIEYALEKITHVTEGNLEVTEINPEYLRSNLVEALNNLEQFRQKVEQQLGEKKTTRPSQPPVR